MEGNVPVKLETVIAFPLSHAADPGGLRSPNTFPLWKLEGTLCRAGACKGT